MEKLLKTKTLYWLAALLFAIAGALRIVDADASNTVGIGFLVVAAVFATVPLQARLRQ